LRGEDTWGGRFEGAMGTCYTEEADRRAFSWLLESGLHATPTLATKTSTWRGWGTRGIPLNGAWSIFSFG
jgi:hypothetical protein